jgi:hypothetical protein
VNRAKIIKVRVTDDELRQLKTLAGKPGVSAFLRLRALGPDRHQQQSERLALIAELARIRNLLVQIARSSERQPPPAHVQIVTHLIAAERQLANLKLP